jgi:hypothetical protein
VLTPDGSTAPVTFAAVALVTPMLDVVALGAPGVKLIGAAVVVPEPLVALIAAQYLVPVVSPLRLTVTG